MGKAVLIALTLASLGCATCGTDLLLGPGKRAFNALKNRTALPAAADIDPRVSLGGLLAPGHDRTRWQETSAAVIEGYVIRVHDAGPESANCFAASRLDAHIEVGMTGDAAPRQRVIVEVTPPMRAWAEQHGQDWSTATLQRKLTGRLVRFEGWLFYDAEHEDEAENTRPGHRGNWRATAWELHPVTAIAISPDW